MYTLGVETSCDETAAAVLRDTAVLSNIVSSQVKVHERYGGVVPELASREHLKSILPVLREALNQAKVSLDDIGLVAATCAPGLIGALLVGVSAAKAIAYARNIPFIGVHHGEGHILAAQIEYPGIGYPYIALLASGGHTALYHVKEFGSYRMMGQTRDDAAGEAYDKVAKLLDLPYPGGPVLDRLAREGDPEAVKFPRGRRDGFDFSFSGLKTAVRNHVVLFRSKDSGFDPKLNIKDVAASFQAAVVDTLVEKTMLAAQATGAGAIVVAGGVAANSSLRERMRDTAEKNGIRLYIPGMPLCADNAAMIALAGYLHFQRGERSSLDLNPKASMAL
ncbi:MAG TPA: tRNA (adenosine(37)-N6)-threonylcarbamoyltransferase complex transferase subunit TsaD [Nitrospirota bacterium]|nr:tRNA (adenosine(37)-N6)-threonylcarbamoyltransferase complex transferase subunit TsaD [Nitrospirota bacterium]